MNAEEEAPLRRMMSLWEEAQAIQQQLRAGGGTIGKRKRSEESEEEREARLSAAKTLIQRGQSVLAELRERCTCVKCNKILKKPLIMSTLCHTVCTGCIPGSAAKVKACPICSTACSVDKGAMSQLLDEIVQGFGTYDSMVGQALASIALAESGAASQVDDSDAQKEQSHAHEADSPSTHAHSHNLEQLPPGIDPEIVFCVTGDKLRPYHCLLCGRNFPRDDHLKAHIQQHASVKPFKCSHAGCEKLFSALDALWAHETLPHDELSLKQADSLAAGKHVQDSKASGHRARTRRAAAEGEDLDLSSMTHCNCGFTAVAQGAPCCASEECPCVVKGVVCVACGCRNCKNKKKPRL